MKQFIVLCSTILLGIAIFKLIMGESDDSIINTVKEVWQSELVIKTRLP
ncbi:hypothetical protein [Anaerovorax odorimutans]|nr:hypothetical protein [Anaerovorax odorimutans]